MVTDNLIVTTKNYFTKKYTDKGFLKTKVNLDIQKDTSDINIVNMNIYIDKGSKIKVKEIVFTGNQALSGKTQKSDEKHQRKINRSFLERIKIYRIRLSRRFRSYSR